MMHMQKSSNTRVKYAKICIKGKFYTKSEIFLVFSYVLWPRKFNSGCRSYADI